MNKAARITLRPATEADREILYRWRSDPTVRANSFHTQEIPFADHCVWFEKLMRDPSRMQFIAESDGEAVGQIRFAIEDQEALISYSIDGEKRGRGLGTALLEALAAKLRGDARVLRLVGDVKKGNTASRRAFLRAGFAEQGQDEAGNYRYTLEN